MYLNRFPDVILSVKGDHNLMRRLRFVAIFCLMWRAQLISGRVTDGGGIVKISKS